MANSVVKEITLNNRKIKYILEYKNVKNINIHITPEKGFYISAPFNINIDYLEKTLKSKSNVILDAIDKCEKVKKGSDPKEVGRIGTNKHTVMLNGKKIEYELQFKKVKRINLSVSVAKGVHVSAPNRTSIAEVERFIKDNAEFVLNAVEKYQKLAEAMPKAKKYEDGEYIYFLGEKKTLKVTQSKSNFVEIKGSEIHLFVTDINNFDLKEYVINEFMKNECEKYVVKMCKDLYPRFKKKGIPYPNEIRFKKMVSCWGNCRPTRSILTFSTYLIQLPPKSIEAVVCHEFTHFLHANHSKDFYNQLTEFMPDWKIHDKVMKELQKEIIIKNT